MFSSRFFLNPAAARYTANAGDDPLPFHRLLPGYATTPLIEAPGLAAKLGVAQVLVKDESQRMGLPAFKILGASWAVARALGRRLGADLSGASFAELVARVAPLRPLTLAAATDGNHGRAVARMAALLGLDAHILVPAGTAQPRVDAIAGEGARVEVVDGTYDDAVARSAALAGPRCLVISDTSWPGYEDTPRDVIAGYATIFREIDAELAARGAAPPEIIFVQVGVGALAAAVVRHYRQRSHAPIIVGVEPERAACVLASLEAGRIVSIPGPHDSIMAGLNCGTPSLVAWPDVSRGLDLAMAIGDERAGEGMRALARDGVVAGETGAAGAGGLIDLCTAPDAAAARGTIGLGPHSRVLLLCTEGATDPAAYRSIVGQESRPS
jgi:diaminopropionate ammonia-lyase